MARWEYKFEVFDLQGSEKSLDEIQEELNRLGQLGWEVASIVPQIAAGESRYVSVLKREIATLVAKHG